MSKIIAESERLILRQFNYKDTEFIIELLNTDGWIKYIGDRKIKTTEQAKGYLKNGPMKSYQINGFGLGLVELKEKKIAIGMCGLIKRDYLDHPDIGFAFLPYYTGKGYAYEIAVETIRYAFNKLMQQRILAITLPENISSIKLLEKLELKYEKAFITEDTNEELLLYAINKEEQ